MIEKTVLYAEDEEDDAFLLKLAFKRAGVTNPVCVLDNGESVIEYLSGTGEFADRSKFPLPGVVLLDLNLPRLRGLKVLEWIRQQPQFACLPVVVYTSSEYPQDRKEAQELGANDYVVKPSLIQDICEWARQLQRQWLQPT